MGRAVDRARVEAQLLHDVDLAAGGPVVAHQPDGRPDAARAAEPGADFEEAVGPARRAVGDQTRRAIGLAAVIGILRQALGTRFNNQLAVVDAGILRSVGRIVLGFAVEPTVAVAPGVVAPFAGRGHRAVVELIRPHKVIAGRYGAGGTRGKSKARRGEQGDQKTLHVQPYSAGGAGRMGLPVTSRKRRAPKST